MEGPVSLAAAGGAAAATGAARLRNADTLQTELTQLAGRSDCTSACQAVVADLTANIVEIRSVATVQTPDGVGLDLNQLKTHGSVGVAFPPMSHVSVSLSKNDGKLGEWLTALAIKEANPGLEFRAIQNTSGNGIDLVAIDPINKTIVHVEVKSTVRGEIETLVGLDKRFNDWIDAAGTTGILNRQQLPPGMVAFAE